MSSLLNTTTTDQQFMADYAIIPHPSALTPKQGCFNLDQNTIICPDQENLVNAEYLQRLLRPATGFSFEISHQEESSQNKICLEIGGDTVLLGEEGYRLSISETAIHLSASSATGIFYAIQTLRQLLPAEVELESIASEIDWKLPCVEIEDSPKYAWRGFMLDEARHFQGMKTVKKLLDQMALLKLNRFHWHLTDDQGWRIEIKQYPRLTEVGGRRAGTVVGAPYLSKKHNHIPHLGFYSQEEIREIVDFAAERHIMVIPEIEMPGHSLAALAAYPEFSCTGGPFEVATRWGVFSDIYCAGKQETYTFLEKVLSEVIGLFPAPYIHIGGDEAPKRRWKACPDCQKILAEQNLASEHSLQIFLTNQIAGFVRGFGKRIIFWSDSFDEEITPDAIVHYWIGNRKKVLESVRDGRDMISSPYFKTYLDQSYTTVTMKNTVEFNPDFDQILEGAEGQVLGLEGLLWGEWLPNFRRVEYQAFPRLIALAEAGWQPGMFNGNFESRLQNFLPRLDLMDIGYKPLNEIKLSYWEKLMRFFQIPVPKKGISKPVEEEDSSKNLVEIPLHLSGSLFRSPMPFAMFDNNFTTFQEYLDVGISTVVMLVEDGEDHHYANMDLKQLYNDNQMNVIHFPIMDFDTPEDSDEFRTVLYQVADLYRNGENIAIHCFAGRGRTGFFIALLVRLISGMDGQQAINFTRQFFPAIETVPQEILVREFKFEASNGEDG